MHITNFLNDTIAKVSRRAILVWFALVVAGCSTSHQGAAGEPRTYPLPSSPNPGPADNWPVAPGDAAELLAEGEVSAVSKAGAGGGVTGAKRVKLYWPERERTFSAKWKLVPRVLDGYNNSPRREVASYQVQRLFLDPEDYVVPPTTFRCVPLERYRRLNPRAQAWPPEAECVLGVLSLWLEDVHPPKKLYDEERFATDANYAYHMANFNLLTFLIDHKDGRGGNFLVSNDESDRRVFAVDNGIAFDAWIWNYFVPNWDDIRVPALRKESVDRLRDLTREDLAPLAVLAEMHLDDEGVYRLVAPGLPIQRRRGVRTAKGVIQFGLTRREIENIWEQIGEIIEDVDEGKIPVF